MQRRDSESKTPKHRSNVGDYLQKFHSESVLPLTISGDDNEFSSHQ